MDVAGTFFILPNPNLILFDNSLNSLDGNNSSRIKKLIKELKNEYEKIIIFIDKDINNIYELSDQVIIIDNNPVSYTYNKMNGLPILTWHSIQTDNELIKLIPLLEYLSKVDDVRPIINEIINREKNEIDFEGIRKILNAQIEASKKYIDMVLESVKH